MSIPNEALQKLMQEIETQAQQAQQQIQVVRQQIAGKQRDIRLFELTSNELKTLPSDTKVYDGVGKMFISNNISTVTGRLSKEQTDTKGDISNLEKKLHYLETTFKNSKDSMDKILNHSPLETILDIPVGVHLRKKLLSHHTCLYALAEDSINSFLPA